MTPLTRREQRRAEVARLRDEDGLSRAEARRVVYRPGTYANDAQRRARALLAHGIAIRLHIPRQRKETKT